MKTYVMTKSTEDKIVARTLREIAAIHRSMYGINSRVELFETRANDLDPPKPAPTIRERAEALLREYYHDPNATLQNGGGALSPVLRKHFGDLL